MSNKYQEIKELLISKFDDDDEAYFEAEPLELDDVDPCAIEIVQAPELVSHPGHYNHGSYETIDVIEDWSLGFHCGNAIKYISRHKHKGTKVRDIEKAIWYLERYLETLEE